MNALPEEPAPCTPPTEPVVLEPEPEPEPEPLPNKSEPVEEPPLRKRGRAVHIPSIEVRFDEDVEASVSAFFLDHRKAGARRAFLEGMVVTAVLVLLCFTTYMFANTRPRVSAY